MGGERKGKFFYITLKGDILLVMGFGKGGMCCVLCVLETVYWGQG